MLLKNSKLNIIFEQGFISLLNFGSILVFSKFLNISDFSRFILIYSIVSFAYLLTTFFVTSPILVFIPKYWKEIKNTYLLNLFLINIVVSGIVTYFSFTIYGFFKLSLFSVEVFLFAILWTTYELLRKYTFGIQTKVYGLAISSLVMILFFFLNISYKIFFSKLILEDVFRIYVMSYALSIIVAFAFLINFRELKMEFKSTKAFSISTTLKISRMHYKYSRWLIIGGIAFWVYSQGYYVLAEPYLTELELGKVRTIQNITGLFSIIIVVFENFYTPKAAGVYLKEGKNGLINFIENFYKKYHLVYLSITVLVVAFSYVLYNTIYLEKYNESGLMIIIFISSQLILFFVRPLIIALRTKEITYPFSLSHIASALFILTFGVVLANYYTDNGMAFGFLISAVIFSLVILNYYLKKVKLK